MIPLLHMKTADTANMGIFASVTRPFSNFWVGPGDEASILLHRQEYKTNAVQSIKKTNVLLRNLWLLIGYSGIVLCA